MFEEFFYERLTQLRMQKGVSAREMSLALGQSPGYINKIENKNALPSMGIFFYICDYLKISPQEFFNGENKYPKIMNNLLQDLNELDEEQIKNIANIVKDLKNIKK